jgi:hypothetical protein
MPRATSKPIDPAITWANLLQAEVSRRGTVFPKGSKTFEEIQDMREKAGLPWGVKTTKTIISKQVKSGAIKAIQGVEPRDGRLVRAVRYLIA